MDLLTTQIERKQHVPKDYRSELKPIWCKGCGNFSVLSCIHKALAETNIDPHNVAVVSGIGCSSRLPGYCSTYSFNSIHGRALPIATGVKLARPDMTVLVAGGDGDGLSIGGGHLPHAARRNVDMTYVLMDNEIYGLTKGQASPSSPQGDITKSSPHGTVEMPLDPISLALAYNISYVARTHAGDGKHLTQTILDGINHPGFAFIHVLLPCPTYRGMVWFKGLKAKTHMLPDDHDYNDRAQGFAHSANMADSIPIGLFYKEIRPTMDELSTKRAEKVKAEGGVTMEELLKKYRAN